MIQEAEYLDPQFIKELPLAECHGELSFQEIIQLIFSWQVYTFGGFWQDILFVEDAKLLFSEETILTSSA